MRGSAPGRVEFMMIAADDDLLYKNKKRTLYKEGTVGCASRRSVITGAIFEHHSSIFAKLVELLKREPDAPPPPPPPSTIRHDLPLGYINKIMMVRSICPSIAINV
jgi:hypothetical protein